MQKCVTLFMEKHCKYYQMLIVFNLRVHKAYKRENGTSVSLNVGSGEKDNWIEIGI